MSRQAPVRRCDWAAGGRLETAYHDLEWGVPVHDDRVLFEFLLLEGAQAGLSWSTILRKREAYRAAFSGFDPESVAGLVGAGATAVVFTTGNGTMIGNAICPVIKLTSNTPVFERMSRDLDLNAGTIVDGTESIAQVGQRVFEHVRDVAAGTTLACAEQSKHREFQIWLATGVTL